MNIEYGIKDWTINNVNSIKLTYFDVVGQQKLVVNDKEYNLKNGLQVVINKGDRYRIDSLDKHCKRVYSKKIVLGLNSITMKSIINKNIAFRVFGLTIEQLSMLYGVLILALGTACTIAVLRHRFGVLRVCEEFDISKSWGLLCLPRMLLALIFYLLVRKRNLAILKLHNKYPLTFIAFFFAFIILLEIAGMGFFISYAFYGPRNGWECISYFYISMLEGLMFIVSVFYIFIYLEWLKSNNSSITELYIPMFIMYIVFIGLNVLTFLAIGDFMGKIIAPYIYTIL